MSDLDIGGIKATLEVDATNLTRGLDDARRAMDMMAKEIRDLDADLKGNRIGLADHAARTAALTAASEALAGQMRACQSTVTSASTTLGSLRGVTADATTATAQLTANLGDAEKATRSGAGGVAIAVAASAGLAKAQTELGRSTIAAQVAATAQTDSSQSQANAANRVADAVFNQTASQSRNAAATVGATAAAGQAATATTHLGQSQTTTAVASQTQAHCQTQANSSMAAAVPVAQAAAAATGALGTAAVTTNAAMRAGQERASGWSRGFMQLGAAIEDSMYGVNGVINNLSPMIQGFATGLGASTAKANMLGTAVQLAAVAAYQLSRNWHSVTEALGMPTVETAAEEMSRLGQATSRTADETARLNRYRREQAEIGQMSNERPEAETKAAKDIGDVIVNADIDRVVHGLFQTIRSTGQGAKLSDEEKAKIKDPGLLARLGGDFVDDLTDLDTPLSERTGANAKAYQERRAKKREDARRAAAEEKLRAQDEAKARDLLRDAKHDPLKLKALLSFVDARPGAFPEGFGDQLRAQTPAARAKADADKAEGKADKKEAAADHKADAKVDRAYKAERDQEKARDEGVDWLARRLAPDIDQVAKKGVVAAHLDGKPIGPHQAGMTNALVQMGLDPADAQGATRRAIGRATDAVGGHDLEAEQAKRQHDAKSKRKAEAEQKEAAAGQRDDLAHMLIPGLDKKADDQVVRAMLVGKPMDQVGRELKAELVKNGRGMLPDDAEAVSRDVIGKAQTRVNERIGDAMAGGGMGAEPFRSQIFDFGDLTRHIQSSIGTQATDNFKGIENQLKKLVSLQENNADKVLTLKVE